MSKDKLNGVQAMPEDELNTVSGGIGDMDKEKMDKYMDLFDAVLETAENSSAVPKAGVKGLRAIVKASRKS